MAEAQALSGAKTKRETVQEALELLVRIRRQDAVRDLRGLCGWEGDLEEMRTGRGAG
jgi:Arc/MetJ family transcription regulator